VVKKTKKRVFLKTGSVDINPYRLHRYIGLLRESQLAKCPNAQFKSSFLAQKERFTRKSGIKFQSNSGFLKVLSAKSATRVNLSG